MRVLIVDDSALVRGILKESFKDDSEIQVVGEAGNGEKAVSEVGRLSPDLVIMDVNMPVLDGIGATERIMKEHPVPILIFSMEVDSSLGFRAIQAGAIDVMRKPDIGRLNDEAFIGKFRELLLSLGRKRSKREAPATVRAAGGEAPKAVSRSLVVMGASTGGPAAVRTILSALPRSLPVPIAMVQHLESGFEGSYAEWLNEGTELEVKLVEKPTVMQPGSVYVAPCTRHLLVRDDALVLDDGPPVLNQRPSVNRLFSTAAESRGSAVLGVLLTGMGADGAEGCGDIVRNGGITVVEDRSTAAIYGMPRAAIELGAATFISPLTRIAHVILSNIGERK